MRSAGTRRRYTACRSSEPRCARGWPGRTSSRVPPGWTAGFARTLASGLAPPSAVLEVDVGMKAVHPALTPVARLLVSAELRGRVELVERVAPNHSGAELPSHPEDPRAL